MDFCFLAPDTACPIIPSSPTATPTLLRVPICWPAPGPCPYLLLSRAHHSPPTLRAHARSAIFCTAFAHADFDSPIPSLSSATARARAWCAPLPYHPRTVVCTCYSACISVGVLHSPRYIASPRTPTEPHARASRSRPPHRNHPIIVASRAQAPGYSRYSDLLLLLLYSFSSYSAPPRITNTTTAKTPAAVCRCISHPNYRSVCTSPTHRGRAACHISVRTPISRGGRAMSSVVRIFLCARAVALHVLEPVVLRAAPEAVRVLAPQVVEYER